VAETEDAVATAKAEYEVKVAELQSQIDTIVLEKEAAVSGLADFKAEAEAAVTAAAEATERAAKKTERIEKAKELSFPEDYITANADRWAALTDEVWDEHLAEWAVLAPASVNTAIPTKTALGALTAARETSATRPSNKTTQHRGLMHEVLSGMQLGFDPRSI